MEDSDYYSESDAKQIRAIVRNAYPFQSLEYMQETFNIPTLTKEKPLMQFNLLYGIMPIHIKVI